jgi:hypothetical protein
VGLEEVAQTVDSETAILPPGWDIQLAQYLSADP